MGDSLVEGIFIDLEKVNESTKLVLWGKLYRGNGTISPYMKLLEIPIGQSLELIKNNPTVCAPYFSFE